MWTIWKISIEFATILFLFYVLVFWPWGMWDLSSLTRDQTTPHTGRQRFNHWITREVLQFLSFNLCIKTIGIQRDYSWRNIYQNYDWSTSYPYSLFLFLSSTILQAFYCLNGAFNMIPFSISSLYISYISFFYFLIGCPWICNIHLWLITINPSPLSNNMILLHV